MATYSGNLKLTLLATGEGSGTWGDTTNTNLGTLLEQAISGYTTQAITDGADTTITIPDGATGVARNMVIECTGTLTAARNLIVPSNKKLYFIYNNTTGGYAVTVKVSGQTGVSVPNGAKAVLMSNGTDIVPAANYLLFPDGSAAAPSITNDGDTNTGIFFPAADQVGVAVGGSEIARTTSTGLGVGTTPSYRLDVLGTSVAGGVSGRIKNSDTTTGFSQVRLEGGSANVNLVLECYNNNGTNAFGGLSGGSAVPSFYYNFDTQYWRSAALVERMRLTSTGLGIGCTPIYKLDVADTSTGNVLARISNGDSTTGAAGVITTTNLANSYAGIYIQHNSGSPYGQITVGSAVATYYFDTDLQVFRTRAGTEKARFDSSGNLGIGITSTGNRRLAISGDATTSLMAFGYLTTLNAWLGFGSQFGSATAGTDFTFRNDATGGSFIWGFIGAEKMRLDSSGNLGIGATALGRLDVASDANSAQQSYIRNANAGSSAFSILNLGNNSSNTAFRLLLGSSTVSSWAGANSANLVQALAAPMAFWTNNTERMRIDSSGNVVIGTTTAATKLTVSEAGATNVYAAVQNLNGSGYNAGLYLYNAVRSWYVINAASGSFDIYDATATATRAAIDSSGNFKFNSGYGSAATAYGCRAWINFDGTAGTIGSGRANGNVSSVTDGGVGIYQVNFANAMVDANYCATITPSSGGSLYYANNLTYATGNLSFNIRDAGGNLQDVTYVNVAIHR